MTLQQYKVSDCIYDGLESGYHSLKFELDIGDKVHQHTIKELIDFDDLSSIVSESIATDIALSVNGKMSVFDNNISYNNEKNTLELFYIINKADSIVHIFSAGEFQSGRFKLIYEGVFPLNS